MKKIAPTPEESKRKAGDGTTDNSLYYRMGRFRLGEGHVLFFMNKFEFLYNRFLAVHHECISRGFHVTDYSASFLEMKNSEYWNNWQSSKSADKILINRIIEKIQSSPKQYFMYYSQPITKDELIGRYINYINKYI